MAWQSKKIFRPQMKVMANRDPKRILLVDDAVVVRKVLSQAIGQDPDLEVVATAVNGRVALTKYAAAKPDLVLLDVEMPEMDGLETVRELRKIDSRVPIIMFSTLTERGSSVTLEALALGATNYVTKPSNLDGAATFEAVIHELLPKVRALYHLPGCARSHPTSAESDPSPRTASDARQVGWSRQDCHHWRIHPEARMPRGRLLPMLPAQLPVPLLIAQHKPCLYKDAGSTSFLKISNAGA